MLTPREILQTEFRHAFRGYHEKDVDAFVRRVVKAYETLSKQNKELSDQIESLQDALKDNEREALRRSELLQAANEASRQVKAQAEHEAKAIVTEAQQRAVEIVARARDSEKAAQERVSRLRAEEKEVRESLRTLLEASLQLLDDEALPNDDPIPASAGVFPHSFVSAPEAVPRATAVLPGESEAAAAEDMEPFDDELER